VNHIVSSHATLQFNRRLLSCGLRPVPRDPRLAEEERRVSAIFDRVERACPRLFRYSSRLTEQMGDGWMRNYLNTDGVLQLKEGALIFSLSHSFDGVYFGRESEWNEERSVDTPMCRE